MFERKSLGKKCAEKCKYKCSDLTDATRQMIFDKFWEIGNRCEQWRVLAMYVKKMTVKRRTTEEPSKRSWTLMYFLPTVIDGEDLIFGAGEKLRVCKTTFIKTFNINGGVIKTAVSKYEKDRSFSDRRGSHKNKPRVITGSMVESVCAHVLSFVPRESRNETNELCLNRPLTIKRMYDMYKTWFDSEKYDTQCATLRHYRDIVSRNFKISFRPSK